MEPSRERLMAEAEETRPHGKRSSHTRLTETPSRNQTTGHQRLTHPADKRLQSGHPEGLDMSKQAAGPEDIRRGESWDC